MPSRSALASRVLDLSKAAKWTQIASVPLVPEDVLAPLSPFLRHRSRARGIGPRSDGAVIYWMRLAARDHDNPALDVARLVAQHFERPLLVLHALSEKYPFASDRHHMFFLQGARDVSAAFARDGVPYAFHLERPGARAPVLKLLAQQAFAVVTELMPVDPLASWTEKLLPHAMVLEVDASCLFPMPNTLRAAPQRAFAFRKSAAPHVVSLLEHGYPRIDFDKPPQQPSFDLPFEPIDLSTADPNALVASTEIDHSIAPVAGTCGGSTAGYARWTAYCSATLSRYASTRNDVLAETTSRMSPYLHYGRVSPFAMAHDLYRLAKSNPSADKLLDELLVWRELGFHHAFHCPNVDAETSLPTWAQDTLRDHQRDARASMPSWDQLRTAQTDDAFWNACQISLTAHGELHNNARMTWGKKLIEWTESAQDALNLLLDLNHRYALDGRDPASYSGIRWCLGAFDRPFTPAQPILGTVRARPTAIHQQRLPTAAFDAFVRRAPFAKSARVAVIGSGVAGLAAARALLNHNVEVTVFDKGRRPGGRLVSRDFSGVAFDYGAQYFTAESPVFKMLVGALVWEDVLSVWKPRVGSIRAAAADRAPIMETAAATLTARQWYTANDGFSAFAQRLSRGIDVRQSARVTAITEEHGQQRVTFSDGTEHSFDHVLVTVPSEQLKSLLGRTVDTPHTHLPCWSLSVAFAESLNLPIDAAFVHDSKLAWIACESSKPGRRAETDGSSAEVWTLQSTGEFAAGTLMLDEESVRLTLLQEFAMLLQIAWPGQPLPPLQESHLQRWRYARAVVDTSVPRQNFLHDADGIGCAGDSFGGPRVELAYLSGNAGAGALLRQMAVAGEPRRR